MTDWQVQRISVLLAQQVTLSTALLSLLHEQGVSQTTVEARVKMAGLFAQEYQEQVTRYLTEESAPEPNWKFL